MKIMPELEMTQTKWPSRVCREAEENQAEAGDKSCISSIEAHVSMQSESEYEGL